MKQEPLVSVGLTTYQRPDEFKRALKSVIRQTYKNLEIIVSENYSPGFDIKKRIVKEFLKKDKRITYYQHKPDKGIIFNAKFVLKKATGKYFIFLNDDDYWAPSCVAQLVNELETHNEAALAMCAMKLLNAKVPSRMINFNELL